jgi:hypothetical protein
MSQSSEFPNREKFLDDNGLVAPRPLVWLRDLRQDVNTGSLLVPGGAVSLTSQNAAIGTTPFDTAALTSGQYQVSAFTQVITPASVNSSVTVTFSFTRNTVACTLTGGALTTNDPTKPRSDIFMITVDGGTPISYSTAYVSNLAGMTYDLDLLVQRVNA